MDLTVFLCSRCSTIICDSTVFLTSRNNYLIFTESSCDLAKTFTRLTHAFEGCVGKLIHCSSCKDILGSFVKSADESKDDELDMYCIYLDKMHFYKFGKGYVNQFTAIERSVRYLGNTIRSIKPDIEKITANLKVIKKTEPKIVRVLPSNGTNAKSEVKPKSITQFFSPKTTSQITSNKQEEQNSENTLKTLQKQNLKAPVNKAAKTEVRKLSNPNLFKNISPSKKVLPDILGQPEPRKSIDLTPLQKSIDHNAYRSAGQVIDLTESSPVKSLFTKFQ
eukprot:NODE_347_length_9026_cov_0.640641.p5 type:complete len:278 gc:universal NODE_347_length_9026_cov_0.640641:4829-3996(-)